MSAKIWFALGFFALFLTGCTLVEAPTAQPVVLSVLYNQRVAQPFQADWLILDEYAKRQNVVLDVRTGDDADYEKALIQALESEDIPDIILKVWPETVKGYAASGILLPFSDYEQQMPYFMAYIQQHNLQEDLDKLRLNNGKYYVLPGYRRQIQVQQWIYRQDVFEEQHLAMPTTYDELFDALVVLKKAYPDSTPLTTLWGGAHLFAMMGAGYGIPSGWAGTRDFDPEADLWRYAPATDEYREMVRFLNRCYEADVLDHESLTQTDDEFTSKITDGRAFVTVTWITSGFKNWDDLLAENGVPNGKWAPLPVPASTIGLRALPPVDPFRKGLVVSSSVVNKPYFEKLLTFLDWAVYSDEGMALTTWGVAGVTFEQTPTGKVFLPSPTDQAGTGEAVDFTKVYGLDTMFNLNENEEFEDFKKPPEIVAFLQRSLDAEDAAPIDPQLNLDSSAIEAVGLLSERLDPYAAESMGQFITGALDIEADWDAYQLGLEKRGYKTLEEIWNTAWVAQPKP